MTSAQLTEHELQIVAKALRAAVDGPFFQDWEFETLMGASRDRVRSAAGVYSAGTADASVMADLAISVINNLLGYPHSGQGAVEMMTGTSRAELEILLRKLSR